MGDMTTFIAKRIMEKADKSIEAGRDNYKAFFIKTKIYEKWRADVDAILETDGYGECIVAG